MNLGYGATASSPKTAERLKYYNPAVDVELMNRDRLYTRSIKELSGLTEGYVAKPVPGRGC